MKTVVVKLVVDDRDEAWVTREIEKLMEYALQDIPLYCFESRDATKAEAKWRKRYDDEINGKPETPEGCMRVDDERG